MIDRNVASYNEGWFDGRAELWNRMETLAQVIDFIQDWSYWPLDYVTEEQWSVFRTDSPTVPCFGADNQVEPAAAADRDDGLNDSEGVVMDALVKAANAYARLPVQHPSDMADFVVAIHRCQELLAVRIVRRVFPKGWTNIASP